MTHRGPFQPLPFCDSVRGSEAEHRAPPGAPGSGSASPCAAALTWRQGV